MKGRNASAALLTGLVLLGIAALLGPRTAPPVYDGACIADPYRYLSPPADAPSADKPSPASKNLDLASPTAAQITTDESPPQVQVIFPAGAIRGRVTFVIRAVPPPPAHPPNGSVDGNVYSIAASGTGGSIATISQPMSVVLRSPKAASARVLDVYANGRWTALDTVTVSCAYQWLANTKTFGQYALVDPLGTTAERTTAGSQWTTARIVVVAAGLLATIVAVTTLVRTRRHLRPTR